MADFWGQHLIVDAKACDPLSFNKENIIAFTKQLVQDIDMVAYGEPILEHFASHDPDKGGYTLVQLIETSNITAHFVDANGDVYFDVFSCKPFSTDAVLLCIQRYFKPTGTTVTTLFRKA